VGKKAEGEIWHWEQEGAVKCMQQGEFKLDK
jgi:hypothetical protein